MLISTGNGILWDRSFSNCSLYMIEHSRAPHAAGVHTAFSTSHVCAATPAQDGSSVFDANFAVCLPHSA